MNGGPYRSTTEPVQQDTYEGPDWYLYSKNIGQDIELFDKMILSLVERGSWCDCVDERCLLWPTRRRSVEQDGTGSCAEL